MRIREIELMSRTIINPETGDTITFGWLSVKQKIIHLTGFKKWVPKELGGEAE